MGFELASAYVTVSAKTEQADREIADVKGLMASIPAVKTIKIQADTSSVKAGLQAAARAYDIQSSAPASGRMTEALESAKAQRTAKLLLDNRQFANQITASQAKLAAFPGFKAVRLNLNAGGFAASLAAARAKLASFSSASISSFAGATGGALAMNVAFSAVPAVLGAAGQAIQGASHYAETVSKVGVVFGEASGAVVRFSNEMQSAFGSSKNEILDSAAGFGLVGKAAGLTQAEAANLGITFAKLADDASSFYDVPLEEALTTLKSALVGESEPIRRFGVLLNEDAVKAEAFRLGVMGANKTLTESAKVMARVSLIQQGMADAQGDHARTAGSFANQWREFTGRLADFGQSLGAIALPALNLFLRALNPIVAAMGKVADIVSRTTDLFGEFFAAAGKAVGMSSSTSTGAALPGAMPGETPAAASASTPAVDGMAAARESVKKEEADADKKRLVDKAREEAMAEKTRVAREKAAANIYKEEWIAAEAKRKEARLNADTDFGSMLVPGMAEAERARNAERARTFAERDYASGRASYESGAETGIRIAPPPKDMPERRKGAEDLLAGIKDKVKQGLGIYAEAKNKGLGVLGGIASVVVAKAEETRQQNKALAEKSPFQSEFLTNTGLSQKIQAAALSRPGEKKEEKEMVKNTAQAVFELKQGFAALNATLRGLRGVSVYQS